ncbi:MAG: Unknown protein [uncultured Sulfurovum sp.]|uniref:Uncharacterized protein n=1 Tax=uncultured Sulfurovum sp. TaxID=269237 RepID=A0A6S6SF63_9BACT|nr:MAG: Unknown protein [uncultured Sulfurovum sp.]
MTKDMLAEELDKMDEILRRSLNEIKGNSRVGEYQKLISTMENEIDCIKQKKEQLSIVSIVK